MRYCWYRQPLHGHDFVIAFFQAKYLYVPGCFRKAELGSLQLYRKRYMSLNRCMEIAVWFAEQSLLCVARPVAMLFIFTEDLGGNHRDGPASPWTLQELRQLQGVSDARRGAAFLCRLAESEYRRPLGFLSNMDTFCSQLYDGWPSLSFTEDSLVYDGSLPKRCPCRNVHKTFKGLTQANDFISSATVSLGVWARVLPSISDFIGSLGDGGFSANLEPTRQKQAYVFSLASSSSSWSSFYRSWLAGDLTRLQLSEYARSGTVDNYLRGTTSIPLDSFASLSFTVSPSIPRSITSTVALPHSLPRVEGTWRWRT